MQGMNFRTKTILVFKVRATVYLKTFERCNKTDNPSQLKGRKEVECGIPESRFLA